MKRATGVAEKLPGQAEGLSHSAVSGFQRACGTGFQSVFSRGQTLLESTLALLVFLAMLLGVMDCAQLLFAHQSLVERVNRAVRWGVTHPWQGSDPVLNLVLHNQTEEPREARPGYLGLRAENVVVRHRPATADRPDDEILSVEIVNFEARLFSPWVGQALVSRRPVLVSAPMSSSAGRDKSPEL